MTKYEFKDRNGDIYTRITLRLAYRLFNENKYIVLCPSNLRPFSMFNPQITISNENGDDFSKIIEHFKYYNCTDRYTGRDVYFYARKDTLNND